MRLSELTSLSSLQDGAKIARQSAKYLRISSARLRSRGDYSCQGVNTAGPGGPGTAALQVGARPRFLQSLSPYTGVLTSSESVALQCQVECSPACRIGWYKNGTFIRNKARGGSHLTPDHLLLLRISSTPWRVRQSLQTSPLTHSSPSSRLWCSTLPSGPWENWTN